jgi:hypothetical protein
VGYFFGANARQECCRPAKSYLCVTCNFDGMGESGACQNIGGLYLIDRSARPFKACYTAANIGNIEK